MNQGKARDGQYIQAFDLCPVSQDRPARDIFIFLFFWFVFYYLEGN